MWAEWFLTFCFYPIILPILDYGKCACGMKQVHSHENLQSLKRKDKHLRIDETKIFKYFFFLTTFMLLLPTLYRHILTFLTSFFSHYPTF